MEMILSAYHYHLWRIKASDRNMRYHSVALELLCSISSFVGFEKRGVKVMRLLFAHFYFYILTAGFEAHRIPNYVCNFVW